MTEVLLALPSHLRKRLESALEAGTLGLPVPHISLAGLVNHPNSSRSSKAKAMATSWM